MRRVAKFDRFVVWFVWLGRPARVCESHCFATLEHICAIACGNFALKRQKKRISLLYIRNPVKSICSTPTIEPSLRPPNKVYETSTLTFTVLLYKGPLNALLLVHMGQPKWANSYGPNPQFDSNSHSFQLLNSQIKEYSLEYN